MVDYNMHQLLYLLVIFQLPYTPSGSRVSEDGNIYKVSESRFLPIKMTRSLTGNSKHGCLVDLCKRCTKNYKICELCEEDCELKDQKCEKKSENSSVKISLPGMIALIVSLSVFSITFCVLCLYFARKYRPKYSGSPNMNLNHTKSEDSISNSIPPDEPNSATILLNSNLPSPTSPVSQANIQLNFLKVIFRSLASMEKNEDIQENCPICFSSMTLKRLKILNCKHLIHYKCCKDWIMTGSDKCPTCSVNLTA